MVMPRPPPQPPRLARPADPDGPRLLDHAALDALLALVREDGRTIVGPTERDGAIVYDEIEGVADLPRGRGDEQAPGTYRVTRRDDDRLFGYVMGPSSPKR